MPIWYQKFDSKKILLLGKEALLFLCLVSTILAYLRPSMSSAQEQRLAVTGGGSIEVSYFASLRSSRVNLRTGPGPQYPVEWEYHRRGLPIEVIASYERWRRIRDWEGVEGWIHDKMLSRQRTILVKKASPLVLRERASESSRAIARVASGVIGQLITCRSSWCRVEVGGYSGRYEGWLHREGLWGISDREDAF